MSPAASRCRQPMQVRDGNRSSWRSGAFARLPVGARAAPVARGARLLGERGRRLLGGARRLLGLRRSRSISARLRGRRDQRLGGVHAADAAAPPPARRASPRATSARRAPARPEQRLDQRVDGPPPSPPLDRRSDCRARASISRTFDSEWMSMRQPVSCEARRTFWPFLPIASDSLSSGTMSSIVWLPASMMTRDDLGGRDRVAHEARRIVDRTGRCRSSRRAAPARPPARASPSCRRRRRPGRRRDRAS